MPPIRVVEVLVPGAQGPPGVVQSIVAGDNVDVDGTDPANPIVSSSGGGDVMHVAVDIAYNTPGLSSPSGAIPGVVVYTPTVGDVLVDAWWNIDPEWTGQQWDGTTPKGDLFTTGNGWWASKNGVGGALDMTVGDDAGVLDPELVSGPNIDNASPSLSMLNISNSRRLVQSRFIDVNPVLAVVSTDGTPTGNDPGASKGTAIVHLLIIPA